MFPLQPALKNSILPYFEFWRPVDHRLRLSTHGRRAGITDFGRHNVFGVHSFQENDQIFSGKRQQTGLWHRHAWGVQVTHIAELFHVQFRIYSRSIVVGDEKSLHL